MGEPINKQAIHPEVCYLLKLTVIVSKFGCRILKLTINMPAYVAGCIEHDTLDP